MDVIAVPANRRSVAVREVLAAWADGDLLDPFVWWEMGPNDTVQVVGEPGATASTLSDALEGRAGPHRLIGLSVAAAGEDLDGAFAADLAQAFEQMFQVLSYDPEHPLKVHSVVVPGAIGQAIPAPLFDPGWVNVLVAAEERANPSDANRLQDHPDMVDAHAAHALVGLCELWRGARRSEPPVLTLIADAAARNDTSTTVVQCYSRILDGGYVADHVLASVMAARDGWPNPAPARFDRVPDLDRLRDYLSEEFLDTHKTALGLSDFRPEPYVEHRYSIWEALLRFFRSLVDRLLRSPVEIADRVGQWLVDDVLAPRVEHLTGEKVKRWRDRPSVTQAIEDAAKAPTVQPDGPVGQAWSDMRDMAIGLLDGGTVPSFASPRSLLSSAGLRIVAADPASVAPDPRSGPAPVCDPMRWDDDLNGGLPAGESPSCLGDWRRSLLWQVGRGIAGQLREAETKVDQLDQAIRAVEEARAAEKASAKGTRRGFRGLLARFAVITAVALVAGVAELAYLHHLVALGAEVGTGVMWGALILWMAGRHQARLFKAEEDTRREQLEHLNVILEALQRRGDVDRLHRRYQEFLEWSEILGWAVHRPWAAPSLDDVPEVRPIDRKTMPPSVGVAYAAVGTDTLEALTAAASGVLFQPEWLTRMFEDVCRDSARRYLRQMESVADPDRAGVRLPDQTEDTRQDGDSPRHFLLRDIRQARTARDAGERAAGRVVGYLSSLSLDDVFDGYVYAEPPLQPGSNAMLPSAGWLDPPSSFESLCARLRPSVVRVHAEADRRAWGASGVIVSDSGVVATNRHVVAGADSLTVVLASGTSVQVSVLAVSDQTDLALVQLPSGGAYRPVRLSPEPARQGEKVVTIGFPLLLEGDPTMSWGMVAAARRIVTADEDPALPAFEVIQCSYASEHGASGSGVFDLDGQLIGVHSRSNPESLRSQEYMSFAVPAGQIEQLIGSQPGVDAPEQPPPAHPAAISGIATFFDSMRVEPGRPSFLPGHWARVEVAQLAAERVWCSDAAVDPRAAALDLRPHVPARVVAATGVAAPAVECSAIANLTAAGSSPVGDQAPGAGRKARDERTAHAPRTAE